MPFAGTINQLGSRMGVGDRGATVLERSIPVLGYGENFSLYGLAGLQAYYDALTASSVTYAAATGAASAWADLSGMGHNLLQATGANQPIYLPWSGTNYAANFGVASNYFSRTALTAFGTGDFSVSASVTPRSLAAESPIFGGGTNSFGLRIAITTGVLVAYKNGVAALTSSPATGITAGTSVVVGYTRSGTTGTYYINGASIGTITDSQNYTVGQSEFMSVGAGAATANANAVWGRIYTTALSAPAMLADAGGTIQASIASLFNPAEATDGALSWTSSTGEVWTVNQALPGKPALIVGRPGLLFDGSAAFLKTAPFVLNQPTWVVLVGRQLAWTDFNKLIDGNTADTQLIQQHTGTTGLRLYAGGPGTSSTTDLALNTAGVITAVFNGASSLIQINNKTAATGNSGASNAGAFTLGAGSNGLVGANILVNAVAIFNVAPTAADVARVVNYFANRWSISV